MSAPENKRCSNEKKPAFRVLVGPRDRQLGGNIAWFPSNRVNRADAVMYITETYYRARGEQYENTKIPDRYLSFAKDVEMMGGLKSVISGDWRIDWRIPVDDDE